MKHRPNITYANVVASLALFFALCGGAYAASQLPKNSVGSAQLKKNAVTGAKVKKGSLLASDFKAGQLRAGPRGVPGEQGKAGPAGSPGTVGGFLPSGASLKGAFAIVTTATASEQRVGSEISFGIPLTSAPIAHFIPSGSTPPTSCPGNPATPQAAPGHLCIYGAVAENIKFQGFEDPITSATGATVQPFGASVVGQSTAAGDVTSSGSWAVTAP